jgi:threonine/homoserine/homoserine lactone efflux protein
MIIPTDYTYPVMGAFFGLTAGLSPGPLLTLVITETLKHNSREGIKVALAPLITDLPIILLTSFVIVGISHYHILLSLISFSGAAYFAWLGYETINTGSLDLDGQKVTPDSLKKGIAANFLNPNPYIFWLTAGIPTAMKAYSASLASAVMYFVMFYLVLVGSKITVAVLADRSKAILNGRTFRVVMIVLGILLFFFAALFIYDGIKGLK